MYISLYWRDYFIAINWSIILAHKSTQETLDIFVKHFTYAINRYIPITTKPILCNSKLWIDHNVKPQIKRKRIRFNKYYSKSTEEIGKLILLKKIYQLLHQSRVRFESNSRSDTKQNPKCFGNI